MTTMTKIGIILDSTRPGRKKGEALAGRVQSASLTDDVPCPPALAGPANGRHRGRAASERLPDLNLPGQGRHRDPEVLNTQGSNVSRVPSRV